MIVLGLTRLASTTRSRSCPTDRRDPTPARSGASVPGNRSSGDGPEWHKRQSPTWRLPTIVRPRAGSPMEPVSGSGMASPMISYGTRPASAAAAPLTSSNAVPPARAHRPSHSAENFSGERPEPAIRDACLLGRPGRRRIERTDTTRALDLDELTIFRLVDAGNRDAVIRRQQAVAGIDQLRHLRRTASEERRHR